MVYQWGNSKVVSYFKLLDSLGPSDFSGGGDQAREVASARRSYNIRAQPHLRQLSRSPNGNTMLKSQDYTESEQTTQAGNIMIQE